MITYNVPRDSHAKQDYRSLGKTFNSFVDMHRPTEHLGAQFSIKQNSERISYKHLNCINILIHNQTVSKK